jgi:hypothetical protein
MISMMNSKISDSLEHKKNVECVLRHIFIDYFTQLNSFTFAVFSNSRNVCNLTM